MEKNLNINFELKLSELAVDQLTANAARREISLRRAYQLFLYYVTRGAQIRDFVNKVVEIDQIDDGFDQWLDTVSKKYGGLTAKEISNEGAFNLSTMVDSSRGVH